MLVKEMHIEIEQGLNQAAANRSRKFRPEEKDLYLNKIQNRFIQSCLRPLPNGAFEIDQINVDKIQTLIVSGQSLSAYYVPGESRYKCYLPYNYGYLLSDWSNTAKTGGTSSKTLYMTALRQQDTSKSSAMFYENLNVTIKNTTVTLPDDLPYGHTYLGYPTKESIRFIAPYIALKGGWYWEKAGDFNYPSNYIRLSETAGSGITGVTSDSGTLQDFTTDSNTTYTIHTGSGNKVTNRLTPSNRVHELDVPFYKTSDYSPISELSGNILYIYKDSSFIVTGAGVSYVRKPQPISLSLNTSSELPEQFHSTLCDLVVEHLKGKLENAPGMQLTEHDIQKRVTL